MSSPTANSGICSLRVLLARRLGRIWFSPLKRSRCKNEIEVFWFGAGGGFVQEYWRRPECHNDVHVHVVLGILRFRIDLLVIFD